MEQEERIQRATYGLVAVAGAVGLISAAYGGRVMAWAILGVLGFLVYGGRLVARPGCPPRSPGLMLIALGLAPFVNDLALRSLALYLAVVLGMAVAIIGPRIQYHYLRRTP